MARERDVATAIGEHVLDYIKQTPAASAVLVASFLSGHLWVFVITAFFRSKTKGDQHLKTITGRTALGVLWFAAMMTPIYFVKFRTLDFAYTNMLEVTVPTLVVGLLVQLAVFLICVKIWG